MATNQTEKGGIYLFTLDYSNKDPIYQQIVNQTKSAIAKGHLKENDQMPSVRELAKTLLVNQSTITRAYKELENIGVITTVPGKGTFISLNEQLIKWEKTKMKEKLIEIIRECKFLGITKEEIIEIIDKVEKGENNIWF